MNDRRNSESTTNDTIMRINKFLPRSLKLIVYRFLIFLKLENIFPKCVKYIIELEFQKEYVKQFRENIPLWLEHNTKYRYLDEIKKICKIGANTKILDVGCGISSILHYIDGKRYGIDPLADEYKKIYSYPTGIKISQGCGEDIPFPNKHFSVVFCCNVLDHVTNPEKTIDEILRVLVPGGYFVLTVEIFNEKRDRDSAHPHSFTKADANSLVRRKFKKIFEKQSPMMDIDTVLVNNKQVLTLVENKHRTKELVLLLKKKVSGV